MKMTTALGQPFPTLRTLPASLPVEGAIRIELQEGVPIFRASASVQKRIDTLLRKQKVSGLTAKQVEELDRYEEIDDYLSFLNRLVRNFLVQSASAGLERSLHLVSR
jgi:hypothetical protein